MCPIVINLNSPITSSNGEIGITNDNWRAKGMKMKEILMEKVISER